MNQIVSRTCARRLAGRSRGSDESCAGWRAEGSERSGLRAGRSPALGGPLRAQRSEHAASSLDVSRGGAAQPASRCACLVTITSGIRARRALTACAACTACAASRAHRVRRVRRVRRVLRVGRRFGAGVHVWSPNMDLVAERCGQLAKPLRFVGGRRFRGTDQCWVTKHSSTGRRDTAQDARALEHNGAPKEDQLAGGFEPRGTPLAFSRFASRRIASSCKRSSFLCRWPISSSALRFT